MHPVGQGLAAGPELLAAFGVIGMSTMLLTGVERSTALTS
jgi:hypothetical protein